MRSQAKLPRENRTITVDFHDEITYFRLLDDSKAFLEFAFLLSMGFQLLPRLKAIHKQRLYRPEASSPAVSFPSLTVY